MFTIIIGKAKAGECLTFQEAFREFFERMVRACANGMSPHYLVGTSFIEYRNPFLWYGKLYWMTSSQAQNFARQVGMLTENDELQKICRFITLLEIDDAFSLATEENTKRFKDFEEKALK